MQIKAYLKPSCGWSNGVRAIMRKHGLAYEDIDIINNRANYAEMVAKSGQPLSPCVEIDGVMLADISGEEVENYLLANDLIKPTDKPADAPTNAPARMRNTPRWPPKPSASSKSPRAPTPPDSGRLSRYPAQPAFSPPRLPASLSGSPLHAFSHARHVHARHHPVPAVFL